MKKQILTAALWFYAGWYAAVFAAAFLGVTDSVGPIVGIVVAIIVTAGPRVRLRETQGKHRVTSAN